MSKDWHNHSAPTIRLWSRINKQPGGCWEWTGKRQPQGYGQMQINGKTLYAHRLVFEDTFGSIEAGKLICHHCDNPPCCRPDHLFMGTHQDNTNDRMAKGR